ncbi:hypothetical protein QFC20_006868 [Naganishia adeliensis]|uniref:Uncharacterized protein n=1 Tax=Naganishia adeliensis TaxID=92952 RepID=A0ACC2V5C6_9TREE|nr:hypothetical protein QFC20_006868 [Naganishia adeliensis]
MSEPPVPPPRHASRISTTKSTTASSSTIAGKDVGKKTWKDSMKDKGKVWGGKAYEKSWKWSDAIGGRVNDYAGKVSLRNHKLGKLTFTELLCVYLGSERFWPVTGDFPEEMEKAARILRAFTVDGIPTTVTEPASGTTTPNGTGIASTSTFKAPKGKQFKVLRKIPPEVFAEAKGLAIFTSMRSGIAPFGGAGGTGVVVARLPDGSWSGPSSTSPNNLSSGFLLGIDIYDAVLVIRSQKALESFFTHKATLGTDFAVVAGPLGIGATAEAGVERAPVFSYIRSRGFYAGISIMGQVFIERFEENAAMYHWPGIKGADILTGKVAVPREAASLMEALRDAETGKAQQMKGDSLDVVVPEGVSEITLEDGEVLKLPPTPTQVEDDYGDGDPASEKIHYEKHASELTDSLSKAHIQDNATPSAPPPLPPRSRGSTDETAHESHVASPVVGLAQPTDTVNLNEMDPAEAREWQQHLEQEEQSRLAEQRQSLDLGKSEQQPVLDLGISGHQSGLEVGNAEQLPVTDSARPATSHSQAEEDVFHDADTASELPPVYTGAPATAVPAEKVEERSDLR